MSFIFFKLVLLFYMSSLIVAAEFNSVAILPDQSIECSPFTGEGLYNNGQYHFSTPITKATQFYPSSTQCIKLIMAPSSRIVQLTFGKIFFEITGRDCSNDFIEIRDGPYGYSPMLKPIKATTRDRRGRICGEYNSGLRFNSTGRFLWLRFKSDSSIEHHGANASYTFATAVTNKEECRIALQLPVGRQEIMTNEILRSRLPDRLRKERTSKMDCSIDVIAPDRMKIVVSLERMKVRRDDQCEQQMLHVFDGFTYVSDKPGKDKSKICKTLEPNTWVKVTSKRRAIVRVTARDTYMVPQFSIAFTVMRNGECQEKTEFECSPNHCIDSRQRCNGHINCPNKEDEMNCDEVVDSHDHTKKSDGSDENQLDKKLESEPPEEMSYHPIILGSIGSGFLILTLICCCITLKQRMRERECQEQTPARQNNSLSRLPSFHQTDGELLISQTALPGSSSGDAEALKQNGTLIKAPTTPASVRSSGATTAATAAAGAAAAAAPSTSFRGAAAAPSKVRVSKFLDSVPPAGSARQLQQQLDSPIDLFGSEGPSYSAQLCSAHAHSRSLPRGCMKQQQESFETSGSSRDAESTGQYRNFCLPPPPPPPLMQQQQQFTERLPAVAGGNCDSYSSSADAHRYQRSVPAELLPQIAHSQSIPGNLYTTPPPTAAATPHLPSVSADSQRQQHLLQDAVSFTCGSSRTPPTSQSRRATTKLVFQA